VNNSFQNSGYGWGEIFFKWVFAVNRPVLYADKGIMEGQGAGLFLRWFCNNTMYG